MDASKIRWIYDKGGFRKEIHTQGLHSVGTFRDDKKIMAAVGSLMSVTEKFFSFTVESYFTQARYRWYIWYKNTKNWKTKSSGTQSADLIFTLLKRYSSCEPIPLKGKRPEIVNIEIFHQVHLNLTLNVSKLILNFAKKILNCFKSGEMKMKNVMRKTSPRSLNFVKW